MMKKSDTPAIRFKGFSDAWEQCKLGEVFKEYTEKNHIELPALTIIQGGGTVKREDSDRNLMYDEYNLINYKLIKKDDFIVHLRSFEGGLEKSTLDGIISPAYHTFHSDDADSRFYYAYFRSHEFIKHKLVSHVYGIRDGRSIDVEGMKTIEIPYTSIDEQHKIGDFLDILDSLINLHQRKYDKLINVKKSMLEKMFPQNESNVPEIRFKGFTDAWEQREFCNIALRETSTMQSSYDYPSVEYEDVIAEEGRLNKDIEVKESSKKGIYFDGTQVLYGKLRPYLHNWLKPDFSGVAVGDWWVLKTNNADKNFVYRLIQTKKFDSIANQAAGSKMPRADWTLISNFIFDIPASLEEQSKIGKYFDCLDNLIALHQRKLEN